MTTVTGGPLAVTDDTFAAEVLHRDGPVLVDFWAQWCPPCHMIAPVLAEIAAERAGSLTVVAIDADDNPVTARDRRIMAMPTLVLFRDGHEVARWVGARPKARLLADLDKVLEA